MKNKILTYLFIIIIFSFFILNIISKKETISKSERRYLKELPDINIENIMNGKLEEEYEEYASDHFAFRENIRNIKVNLIFNILRQKDYNKLYRVDNYIYKMEYPLNENKVISFSEKINYLYENYLESKNVYYSVIPDKSYYSKDDYLKINNNDMINILNKNINSNIKYIDITKDLNIESYYRTDIHWKQEELFEVLNTLSNYMNFQSNSTVNDYKINEYSNFYGSYYGILGLNKSSDKLIYLTSKEIENAKVKDIENRINKVYKKESLGSIDSYDIYLGGATPIVEITNENVSDRELIIFRDSFASSLAPLLIESYHKITLVDLRYINIDLLDNYIEFNNQDILFLYNTITINNSDIIKR